MELGKLHFFAAFGLFFLATALAIMSANWIIAREAERKAIQAQQTAAANAGK